MTKRALDTESAMDAIKARTWSPSSWRQYTGPIHLNTIGSAHIACLVHEGLFLRDDVPDDVFSHILTFWRSDRDYYTTNYPH